jgi:hypothetical protein
MYNKIENTPKLYVLIIWKKFFRLIEKVDGKKCEIANEFHIIKLHYYCQLLNENGTMSKFDCRNIKKRG